MKFFTRKNNIHITYKKGFTLIESLVAIFMLSVVLATVISLVQSSIQANTLSQAQVTANYVAGEAIEYIRNVRDNQFLQIAADPNALTDGATATWLGGFDQSSASTCYMPDGCDIDPATYSSDGGQPMRIISCTNYDGHQCPALKFDANALTDGGSFYQHTTGPDSVFTRKINLSINPNNPDELTIKVTITGSSGFFKNSPLVVVQHLFNWVGANINSGGGGSGSQDILIPYSSSGYTAGYYDPAYPASVTSIGSSAPYGEGYTPGDCATFPTQNEISANSDWPVYTNLNATKTFSVSQGQMDALNAGGKKMVVQIAVDNDIESITVNGTQISGHTTHDFCPNSDNTSGDNLDPGLTTFTIPVSVVRVGNNTITDVLSDRGGKTYFDQQVSIIQN